MRLTAYKLLNIPLLKLLLTLQQGDDFIQKKKADIKSRNKQFTNEVNKWQIDFLELLCRHSCVFISVNAVLRNEILFMRHNDSLSSHFNVHKIFTLLHKNFF